MKELEEKPETAETTPHHLTSHAADYATSAPKPETSRAMDEPTSLQNHPRGPRIARVRMLDGTIAGEKSPGQTPGKISLP